MSESIKNQLEDIFTEPTTPHSALAILWMDTAYQLAMLMLRQDNAIRSKEKKPLLVPGMKDLHKSMMYIGSFDTYFQMAKEGPDGRLDYKDPSLDRNKVSIGSISYTMLSNLTGKLIEHAHELKGVNMGVTADLIIKERNDKKAVIPDTSGPLMNDFAQPIASKIQFHGYKLMSLLRSNGGATYFPPKSQSSINDIYNLRDVEIRDLEDTQDDPVDIDHFDMNWDLTTGEMLRPKNVFTLSGVELHEAVTLKAVFDAWTRIYDSIHDDNATLGEEVKYQVEQTKAYVKTQQKQRNKPVMGVERS